MRTDEQSETAMIGKTRKFLISSIALLASLFITSVSFSQVPTPTETNPLLHPDGGSWGIRDAPESPSASCRVLIIGDSIANGYLRRVRKALAYKALVDAWITPVTQADPNLGGAIDQIFAQRRYDVVHFNLGLHGWEPGRIPEGQYIPLTTAMVKRMKERSAGAKLIWATITPVWTERAPGDKSLPTLDPTVQPIIDQHNAWALEVMKSEAIPYNDLASLSLPHPEMTTDQYHWNDAGRDLQAGAVVEAITNGLPAECRDRMNLTILWWALGALALTGLLLAAIMVWRRSRPSSG